MNIQLYKSSKEHHAGTNIPQLNLRTENKLRSLVLFHGWGFDSQIWQPLMPELQREYEVIRVDLPGFGLTSIMDWNQFKTELLLKLPLHFAVAGWSLGGLYATRLTIEAPERVTHLLNITSSPHFIADKDWGGISQGVFEHFYSTLSINKEKVLNDFIALQTNDKTLRFNLQKAPNEQGLKQGLDVLKTWDLRHKLQHVSQPTCYLFGRLDRITPIVTMQAMERMYPHFKYHLFRHSAHMPFLSHSKLFLDLLREFII